MRKILTLLLTILVMASCSDPNTKYVKKAVRIMNRHGIYAQGPEWKEAKQEALSAKPSSIEEAQEIVNQAVKVAGGKHSYLMTNEEVESFETTDWEMPTIEFLENGIVFIQLPEFSGTEEEGIKYANTVLNSIPDTLQGIIVDLRGNLGGNMYPMIAAVHRFLPDDVILKFSTRRLPMFVTTTIVVNFVGIEEQEHIDCPVALLTDDRTASSGEAVLLCFRGLENTRTFGKPTAGYASGNQVFPLHEGSQLVLTTSKDVARTGEAFCDDPIEPDVLTETPFETALEWLNERIIDSIK